MQQYNYSLYLQSLILNDLIKTISTELHLR